MAVVCVLLVEDNHLIRMLLAEQLEEAGFDVAQAATGDEAAEMIRSLPTVFTILVTDFHMPGHMDGAGVAALMRNRWPSIPIIIASGRPDIFEPHWRQNLAYHLLSKPFLGSKLVEMVRDLVA